jgi:hypothetical protein
LNWQDVQRKKQALLDEISGALIEDDLNLIRWLLDEERRSRSLPPTSPKVPKLIRDQIDALVKEGE